jgi:hypothetical protein
MTANIIHLPRPHQARSGPRPLALFVRAGKEASDDKNRSGDRE